MNEEIFLKGVRIHRQYLEKELNNLTSQLNALRETCPHTNATKQYHSSSGNYDPSADSEWYEFDCPDCGKHWTKDL